MDHSSFERSDVLKVQKGDKAYIQGEDEIFGD
jgi:hypothetical protein